MSTLEEHFGSMARNNLCIRLTLVVVWRHTGPAAAGPASAVAGRCTPIGCAAERSTVSVGLRASVYVVIGLVALAGYVPSLIADLSPSRVFFAGLPIAFLGLGIYVWTVWLFASTGRGTPLPLDPPRNFVVRGPYRVVRNPMAVGFVLIFIGEAIAFGSPEILAYAALLFAAIHLFIVFVEEPGLKHRFGAPYLAYLESTPRWCPRIAAIRQSMQDARLTEHARRARS